MSANDRTWSFAAPIAELQCGALRGRVDVQRPQLGVHDLQIDGRVVDGALLALDAVGRESTKDVLAREWPAEAVDAYVRENDLVAAYRPTERWPFSPQVYWSGKPVSVLGPPSKTRRGEPRVEDSPRQAPCSLSLLVSVQTDLLDSHPKICVTTRLPAVDVTELRHAAEDNAQAILWRLVDLDWSYLEFVPRSDYSELAIGGDERGRMTCEWRLFGEFLEKGVIRRARVSAAFLSRDGDERAAAECCRQFAGRPLPLTA